MTDLEKTLKKANSTLILCKPYTSHPNDAHLFVVLAKNWSNEFVCWLYNDNDKGLSSGHYFGTNAEALLAATQDFINRRG